MPPFRPYRLFIFNSFGRIEKRLDFDCHDDQHAMETAVEHDRGGYMELWQSDKLIKTFGIKPPKL